MQCFVGLIVWWQSYGRSVCGQLACSLMYERMNIPAAVTDVFQKIWVCILPEHITFIPPNASCDMHFQSMCSVSHSGYSTSLTFLCLCIANILSEYNQQDATFLYFFKTFYMFQTIFPSIIRSSKLHIQHQAFVRPLLLLAASLVG